MTALILLMRIDKCRCQLLCVTNTHAQVLNQPTIHVINPAMYRKLSALIPSILHYGSMANISDLTLNIDLA